MSATLCTVCSEDCDEQLQCSACKYSMHFTCVLGFDPPEEFKTFDKLAYICPPCLVGTSYELLHLAIDAHSRNSISGSAKLQVPTERSQRALRRASVKDNTGVEVVAPPPTTDNTSDEVVAPPPAIDNTGDEGSHPRDSDSPGPGVAPLHPADIARSKRLSFILNTLKSLPDHVTTLILGDSNTHKVRGKDVDSKGNKVCVRSFGGLCIYAAVHALKGYEHQYAKVRKVAWSLGANDAVHGEEQHCLVDYPQHIKALYTETKRVFPNSTVHFILPFLGIKAVTPDFRSHLQDLLKEHAPEMKTHNPPNMSGMMLRDGLHINQAGKEAYINFLMKKFTKNKPQPKQSSAAHSVPAQFQQSQPNTSTGSGHLGNGFESFRLQNSRITPTAVPSHIQYCNGAPASYHAGPQQPQYPQYPVLQQPGLAEALSHTMQRWWSSQQPRYVNSGPIQSWPP